jgi:hypothetical protein
MAEMTATMSQGISGSAPKVEAKGAAEEGTATQEPTIMDTLKADMVTITYRGTAMQITKQSKALIVELLSDSLPSEKRLSFQAQLKEILETDVGDVLVGLLASVLLPYGAGIIGQRGPKVDRLSHEVRLHAGTVGFSSIADKMMKMLAPLLQSIKGLPELPELEGTAVASGRLCAPSVDLATDFLKHGEIHNHDKQKVS